MALKTDSFAPGGALGLGSDGTGGGLSGAFFTSAPSPVGVMFAADVDSTLTAVNGARFFDEVSFFYSSSAALVDAVQVFDGVNGIGNLLASFSFTANASAGCTALPSATGRRSRARLPALRARSPSAAPWALRLSTTLA